MWCIARIDYQEGSTCSPFLNSRGLFGLVWAYLLKDLPSFKELRRISGFVSPTDDLVLLRPDGTVKTVNEAGESND